MTEADPNDRPAQPSIYFFTFHKCASSFFGSYILKKTQGYTHVDYARQIYAGEDLDHLHFADHDHIYGPIRLTTGPTSPTHNLLIKPTTQPEFIKTKPSIFMIRDPRDILISMYFSFGFSHKFSPVKELRDKQIEDRDQIKEKTLDEYVLEKAPWLAENFNLLKELVSLPDQSVLLRYEDMVHDWDKFSTDLTSIIPLSDYTLRAIFNSSRPLDEEDITAHRRSGKTHQYISQLHPRTNEKMKSLFANILADFGYD